MRAWAAVLVLAGALIFAAGGRDALAEAPTARVEVIASWPHDRAAFTQGLVYHRGALFESTGLYGRSTLREVEWQTGRVLRSVDVPREYFAEGLTLFGDRLIQLTYQEHKGFVYDLDFRRIGEFAYEGEGWGLAHDGARLIMSDGTNRLRFLDPTTFETIGTVDVFDDGVPVARLNELEWVRGEIWANVWTTDRIARIDPASGRVIGWLDLAGLLAPQERVGGDVLNGIAYDAEGDRVFVTGKWWPKLFAIRRPGAAPTPSTEAPAAAPAEMPSETPPSFPCSPLSVLGAGTLARRFDCRTP
jgi:glutamine cyclotransferase